MKKIIFTLAALTFFSCQEEKKKENNTLTYPEPKDQVEVEQLASDFKFTEGPAVDTQGNIYFTDIPKQKIWIWTLEDELKLFKDNSGGANGLFFDQHQNLLACEGQEGLISKTSTDGEYIIIAKEFNAIRFNQPNDLWPDAKGGVYFTDPKYGDEENLPQKEMHVYYINPESQEVIQVTDDLLKPNGLIGTADGKSLFITDHGDDKTFKYKIEGDGKLTDKSLFIEAGGDGMSIDQEGNIYLTTSGKMAVEVFSPDGKMIQSIPVPEQPSNVCFGGKNRDELFITARTSIYRTKMNTKGIN